jgi:hypothetical protein
MFDAACERIREVAREADLPLPDALRPDAVPHTKMYHVNLSGELGGLLGFLLPGGLGNSTGGLGAL